jgi:alanyl-tRNA synthetase
MASIHELDELRATFLRFFASKGHLVHPSASLKSDDPTLMFNVAGMQQFKPQFQGAPARFEGFEGEWRRVATSQKCMRAGGKDSDIENVGRTRRHHTFFEMLGNFSFGDYFKAEAAAWAWEFLTDPAWLGLDPSGSTSPSSRTTTRPGTSGRSRSACPSRACRAGARTRTSGPPTPSRTGAAAPAAPAPRSSTTAAPTSAAPTRPGPNTGRGDRFMEIWNLVFTQFDLVDGELRPLPMQNIDTGMGFERLASVVTGASDAYATELFQPTIRRLVEASGVPYRDLESVPHRIVADHVRSVTMCIADGILPANDGAGYVIKMLIRRAARQAWQMGVRARCCSSWSPASPRAWAAPTPTCASRPGAHRRHRQAEESAVPRDPRGRHRARQGTCSTASATRCCPARSPSTCGRPTASRSTSPSRWRPSAAWSSTARATPRPASGPARRVARRRRQGDDVRRRRRPRRGRRRPRAHRFVGFETEAADATVVVALVAEAGARRRGRRGRASSSCSTHPLLRRGRRPGRRRRQGHLDDGGAAPRSSSAPQGPAGPDRAPRPGGARHAARRPAPSASRSTRPGARPRSTTPPRTCCTPRCGAWSATTSPRPARWSPDRLRFDVSHGAPITPEQQRAVEAIVNGWIQADLPVARAWCRSPRRARPAR